MASLLGNLGRLGYMLAGDPVSAGSKSTSEMDPEDRGSSGKSTPTNLHSYHQQYAGMGLPAGALESFPLQLSLGHSADRSQYAANQPAVLAGYGLNRTAVSPLVCWQAHPALPQLASCLLVNLVAPASLYKVANLCNAPAQFALCPAGWPCSMQLRNFEACALLRIQLLQLAQ